MTTPTAHTQTRSEYRDFLAAITASPLDDGVRLVFADWLDEQGDADRAAYIRMEIERAAIPEYEDRALLLKYETDALLQRHWRDWVADVPEWLRADAGFTRGLPGQGACLVSQFLEHADDDWTCVPLHDLTLSGVGIQPSIPRDLWACPVLERIDTLTLSELSLDAAAVAELARSRHLGNLRRFHVGWGITDASAVQALADAEVLAGLTGLSLSGNPLGQIGAEALARANFLPRLEALHLHRCELDADAVAALLDGPVDALRILDLGGIDTSLEEDGVRRIADCPRLASLRRLDLGETLRTEAEVLTLAGSPYLHALERLQLFVLEEINEDLTLDTLRAIADAPLIQRLTEFAPWWRPFDDDGARVVADMSALINVRRLNLTYCGLSSAGLEALLASPYLTRVTALELELNQFGDAGIVALAGSAWLPRLRVLGLNETCVEADGVRALASGDTSRLLSLSLHENPLEDAGVVALCANRWPTLRELRASSSSIGPAGAAALANEGMLPNLVRLVLSGNVLGPTGAEAIAIGPGLASLRELHLDGNRIGDAGALALARSHRRLTELNVEGNSISDEVARALASSPALAEARSPWLTQCGRA